MPTLLRKDGYKFFFYVNERLPKHIHVSKGERYAKIELETLFVVQNYFSKPELRKVLDITKANKEYFIKKWNEYFSR
ncbi:MAG: DUF4160 domain-containing protein [Ignavibacteriales bacterium]|nr:DUF4160 domain-containing protein [Ignavibacteriales bacterium]